MCRVAPEPTRLSETPWPPASWQTDDVEYGTTAGKLLVAGTTLIDPNFFRTVVYVLDHDGDGAFGLVLNRPSAESVAAHLPEIATDVGAPDVVFVGGPVQPEAATGYRRAEAGETEWLLPGVVPIDFDRDSPGTEARVFAGYAGWGSGQLEAELRDEAWYVVDAEMEDLFSRDPSGLWSTVLRRQGGHLALVSTYPPDPSLN